MASTNQAAPAQPPAQRTCFNTFCKEPTKADGRRRGWRLRSGDFAELCERCLCTYEQGNFCETFHNEVAGWRNCEACGKKVHCGCIVSVHTYVLLDAGGVDCITCARKYFGTVSTNQMWMTSPLHQQQHQHPARFNPMRPPASPFPGQWRQSGSLWNLSSAQSDIQQRLAFEFDRPRPLQDKPAGSPAGAPAGGGAGGVMSQVMRDRFVGGPGAGGVPPGLDPANPYSIYHTNSANPSSSQANPSSGLASPGSSMANPGQGVSDATEHVMYGNPNGNPNQDMRFGNPNGNPNLGGSSPSAKGPVFFGPSQIEGSEMRSNNNGGNRPRFEGRNRAQQLLPRYWPRITDQELQQINGESSNSVITPLFEKMLSASDAGRIGRLVLPKKCAEAYFPAIQTPEGLPLTVQDANGKNWTFQFRFWPNNNSRMYVLEGITPCIQAMQLQAGDTVTFSRIDPEGKLVMGFRKAAPVNGEPEIQHLKSGSGFLTSPPPDNLNLVNNTNNNNNSINNNNTPKLDTKDLTANQSEPHKEFPHSAPLFPSRRKANTNLSGGKITKRLRIENEDSMELKVTWEEAQSLLRPPPNFAPTVTVVDGCEFEEYEEPPVLGRRTYFVTNHAGETHQWAQCCECMKWRKIPTDALLTAKWNCSENVWDSERSSCSSPAELTLEQLVELMPTRGGGGTKRKLKLEQPPHPHPHPHVSTSPIDSSDGLDTLANLALLSSSLSASASASPSPSGSLAQPTTRHPRHRPGCSCIVCIQPPSGKGGPKHKASCACNVCITVRRRFRTLMMRKERRVSEKEGAGAGEEGTANGGATPGGGEVGEGGGKGGMIGGSLGIGAGEFGPGSSCSDDVKNNNSMAPSSSSPPMKAQIDLNIQPEKEEDTSPKSVDELAATSAIKLLQDAAAPSPPPPAAST